MVNPIGSQDPQDFKTNVGNLDTAVNSKTASKWNDRFGVERRTWHGIETEANLNIQQAIDAKNAAMAAAMISGFSKFADTLAILESGIGTDYVDGDVVMVFQDESRNDSSSIYQVESGSAVFKNAFDKTREDLMSFTGTINVTSDWGSIPAHTDTDFDEQITPVIKRTEYLNEKTNENRERSDEIADRAEEINSRFGQTVSLSKGRIAIGDSALSRLPADYDIGSSGTVIALGKNAFTSVTRVKKAIAIGPGAQSSSACSRDNIAIGEDSLKFITARTPDYDQTQQQGTRNIAIGGNAMRFGTEAYRNDSIGRNSLQSITTGYDNAVYGSNALAGESEVGLTGDIENRAPYTGNSAVAVGAGALNAYAGPGSLIAIGKDAMSKARIARNCIAIGNGAAANADNMIDGFGKVVRWSGTENGTYSQSGKTITLSFNNTRGAQVGDSILFRLTTGGSATFQGDYARATVTAVASGTITVSHYFDITATGNAILGRVSSQENATSNAVDFVSIGYNTCANAQDLRDSVVLGINSASSSNSVYRSVVEGSNAARFCTTVYQSVILGRAAAIGTSSSPITSITSSVLIGEGASTVLIDGSSISTLSGVIALGENSRVSGNNQLQLGKSGTTSYSYGAVQDRSDARDKADVRDTVLGLDFINDLRAVDFKWDMRDDYVVTNQDGTTEILPKDGSKKRGRYHHGLIAQELREVMNKHGVDFGGFQDHSINGGCDMLSVGYTELIGPLIKAVQELSKEIDDLKSKK